MSIPILNSKLRAPIAAAILFVAVVGATNFLHGHAYYPHVIVEVQENVRLQFLQQALLNRETCQAAVAAIADAVRVSCPSCRVAARQCLDTLEPAHEKLLSGEPIDTPSSSLPRGVVTYASGDKALALAACRETERLAASEQGFHTICYPANVPRPLANSEQGRPVGTPQAFAGSLLLLLTGLASAFAGHLIVRYEALHARWSHDRASSGPQKFHATPAPRIGGLGLMAALFVCGAALFATGQGASGEQFGYLLFASVPAFLGGITEDVTKNLSALARLMLTVIAAALCVWLLGAVIPRLDVPGIDALLRWAPFAVAFTLFAVGGVANSINIIDGYNGLAAGHAVIVLAAMSYISVLLGDAFLLTSALAMIGALLGFLAWNYPKGRIFLGDGGAYLLGFWLAELSVLVVVRHPEVSPWFPMLLLVYPIFETLFSIYRRKFLDGRSPGEPDRMHLHQVIYMRMTRARPDISDPATAIRLNNRVAPVSWLMTLCCAVPAMVFWKETPWLVAASAVFCVGYLLLYRLVLAWGPPVAR